MEVNKYDLFSVPVVQYKDFLPVDLADRIKKYILINYNKTGRHGLLEGDSLSTFTPTYDFLDEIRLKVPGCQEIKRNITKCVDNYTTATGDPKCRLTNSWFNIQQPDSLLKRHSHAGNTSIVTGALYINVDEDSSSLSFENPNPYSLLTTFKNDSNYVNYVFKPCVGDLYLFPCWLIHSSDKINRTKNRIVISFNTICIEESY
jgi:uncharacterized protein (TIGR02466 family)